MIVLVEGVDGSGKTTLCNQLKEYGYTITNIIGNELEFKNYLCLRDTARIYVCDRSFITDIAYRTVDCKNRIGMDLVDISRILDSDYVKIVLCESGSEFADSMERGEDLVTTKLQSDSIKNSYKIITNMIKVFTKVPVMNYNWKKQNIFDVIKFIKGKEEK